MLLFPSFYKAAKKKEVNYEEKDPITLLALCMVLSLLPVAAMAEDGATSVANLTELQTAISEGKTNVTLTNIIRINEGKVSLDLSGMTITGANNLPVFQLNGEDAQLTLTGDDDTYISSSDSVIIVFNGSATIDGGHYENNNCTTNTYSTLYVQTYGSNSNAEIIVNDGHFEATGTNVIRSCGEAGTGTITINGGSFKAKGDYYVVHSECEGTVEINGGSFTSEEERILLTNAVNPNKGVGNITISGGTFSTQPSAYLSNNYCVKTVTEDETTTYVVGAHEMKDVAEIPATCTEAGTAAGTKCDHCGATTGLESISATGHDWSNANGTCKTCSTACGATHAAGTTCGTCGKVTAAAPAPSYPSYPSTPSVPTTSTETTKNEDGSTTTTVTNNKTGTVTETTENTDGSTTVVETAKDGTVTETVTTTDGVSGTVVTDAEGIVTEVTAEVPASADGESVTLPLEVTAATGTTDAVAIEVNVSAKVDSVTVTIPVEDVTPGTVIVLVHEDGTEEVVPKTALTEDGLAIELDGSVTLKVVDNTKTFNDTEDYWADDAITFVTSRELFNGVGNDDFAPEQTMNRAMLATVLWRLEGKQEADINGAFSDVESGTWYTDAINWAAESGIINGYGDSYGTNDPITREQMVTILYRLNGSPAVNSSVDGASDWAADGMAWAVEIGLLQGDGNGLDPQGTATRAQVSTILMRYMGL